MTFMSGSRTILLIVGLAAATTAGCFGLEEVPLDDPTILPDPIGGSGNDNPDPDPVGYDHGPLAMTEWVTSMGGLQRDAIMGLDLLPDGNVVVWGSFESQITLGRSQQKETVLQAKDSDNFLAVFRPDGHLLWARSIGLSQFTEDFTAAAMADNRICAGGTLVGTGQFSSQPERTTTISSHGHSDAFVAVYESNGTLDWARALGGPGAETGTALGILHGQRLILGGAFNTPVSFLENGAEHVLTPPDELGAMMLVVLDSHGNLMSAMADGGNGCTPGGRISPHSDDGFVVAGTFRGRTFLGQNKSTVQELKNELGGHSSTSAGFVAAYTSKGDLSWSRVISASHEGLRLSAHVLDQGSVAVHGTFKDKVVFRGKHFPAGFTALQAQLEAESGGIVFHSSSFNARYDSSGSIKWVQAPLEGHHSGSTSTGITSGVNSGSASAGIVHGATVFADGTTSETNLIPYEDRAPYLLTRSESGTLDGVWKIAERMGGTGDQFVGAVSLGNGDFLVAGTFEGSPRFGLVDDEFTHLESEGESDGFLAYISP